MMRKKGEYGAWATDIHPFFGSMEQLFHIPFENAGGVVGRQCHFKP